MRMLRASDSETARQLKQKFEYHYTPTNGSWLNMAEIELAAEAYRAEAPRAPVAMFVYLHAELPGALKSQRDELGDEGGS